MNISIKQLMLSALTGLALLWGASSVHAQATGGTVTTSGAYTVHTFTTNGSFVVSSGITADVIIIGGGGGGGAQHAAGGGAGGLVAQNSLSVGPGSYSIVIGPGGNGCPSVYGTYGGWSGQNGGNSSAFGYTALGGGGGGGTNGNNGGCGGGANASAVNGFAGTPGAGSQGYNGAFNNTDAFAGGGGGGLGSAGNLSNGGSALATWAGTFGGGGGGGYVGGSGGAGAGAGGSGANPGGSAGANTGSGGGGGGNFSAAGGNGGSGIVVIRYQIPAITRSVNIAMPTTPIVAGQSLSIQASASTDATDGEQIGFFHYEYSTDGGASWNAVAYDVNVGGSATRTANFTAGAVGSTVMVRARIAFRGGAAGDVDYAGNAINWSGSWGSWSTPPTKYGSAEVRTAVATIGTAGSTALYHLKGEIVKSGHPSNAQVFGDGVLFEVFKHTSAGVDTVLWSSLLARPNASHPAKVNLTVDLATGDSVRYRLVSHTADVDYDAVTFPSAFVLKTANVHTQNVSLGSTLAQINTAIGNAVSEMNNPSTPYDRAEVVLASGTYNITGAGAAHGEALIAINGTKNVTLRGPGAKLVIVPDGSGNVTEKMFITTENSSNIEIADLELDYSDAALPYIQGTVTTPGSTPTVSLTWAPQHTSRFASNLFSYRYDPTNTARVLGDFALGSCSISGSTATLSLSAGTLATGDVVVMSIRGNTARLQEAALRVNNSTDSTFRNLTLRAGGWISMIGKHNNGLHFIGYNITRAPSSARIITTNGDGIRLNDSLRGPTIEGCYFERMMDDGINIHAGIRAATYVSGSVFSSADLGGVKIGDTLKVFTRNGSGVAGNYSTPHVVTGISGSNVTVTGTLTSGTLYYVNVSASGEGFLIRDNVIKHTRFRGALIQTGYGFIEGNLFTENFLNGISFEANLSGGSTEGAYPHHTPVQANTFAGNSYGYDNRAIRVIGDGAASPMYEHLVAEIIGNVFNNQTSDPVDKGPSSETFNSGANEVNY